jgi:hypothetical protein
VTAHPQIQELPEAVATYLTTPKDQLSEVMAQVFTDDSVVHDDGHTHIGIDEIESWTNQVAAAFTFTRTVTSAIVHPHAAIVGGRLGRRFSGKSRRTPPPLLALRPPDHCAYDLHLTDPDVRSGSNMSSSMTVPV